MEKQNKHIATRFERFLEYFRGLLSPKAQHDFEKELMQDPFSEEAFEGLSRLSPEEMEKDIAALQEQIAARSERKSLLYLPVFRYAAAATIFLILGISVFLIRQSIQKAPSLKGMAEVIDSMPPHRELNRKNKDSLKQNIAYTTSDSQKDADETSPPGRAKEKAAPVDAAKKSIDLSDESVAHIDHKTREAEDILPQTELEYTLKEEQKDIDQALSGRAAGVQISREPASKRSKSASPAKELNIVPYENDKTGDQRTIRGWVVSADDGEPIPGVNIVLKGTSQGTVTDIQGNFMMNVPSGEESVLTFSFVGYETEEMKVSGNEDITLALNEDMMSLDEVVVIGYGTQKKSDLTGSIATVRAEEPDAQPAAPAVIIKPQPVLSAQAFKDYIQENIRYNLLPRIGKTVIVKISFTVSEQGEISNISVRKSAGKAFDDEAIRLLKEGPAWLPGTVDGRPVRDELTLKIKFEPQESM